MSRYLLDTNILIDFSKRREPAFSFVQRAIATGDELGVTAINVAEFYAGLAPSEQPAAISEAALTNRCSLCGEALAIFVEAYGAEAGNLGLRGVATAGVFVGGGIAPKILAALQDGRFMNAFRAKAPMAELVSAMPVHVIVNSDAGLLGAAVAAQGLI